MDAPPDEQFAADLERWASLHEEYLRDPEDAKAVALRRLARRLAARVARLKKTTGRRKKRR